MISYNIDVIQVIFVCRGVGEEGKIIAHYFQCDSWLSCVILSSQMHRQYLNVYHD
jgi:hypothetical protein